MSNDEIVRLKDAPDRVVSWAIANRERVLPKGVSLQDFLDHGTYHPTDDHVRLTFGGVSNKWRVE